MSACPTCGGEMRPLLTSEFCPNDCDRRPTVSATDNFKRRWDSLLEHDGRETEMLERLVRLGFANPYSPSRSVPLIRNILVEVEPMELPRGLLFCFDKKEER